MISLNVVSPNFIYFLNGLITIIIQRLQVITKKKNYN